MTNYNWNKAETVRVGARRNTPNIIIRKSGGIHLNSSFIRTYNLQDKKYVRALIIKEDKRVVIGFKFLNKKDENTFTLSFGKKTENAGFSGRSVFTEAGFNIEKKGPISFEPRVEDYEGDKIFIIELKKEEKDES